MVRERGSVLLLMPAAVLIVVVLGGLAVDRAVVLGAQRELVAAAQAAADDAASAGLDPGSLRRGELRYAAPRVDAAIAAVLQARQLRVAVSWRVEGDRLVVRLQRQVRWVFGRAVPGAGEGTAVRATASAELRRR